MIYKICVNQLFMLSVRLPGSCALLVKFWGSQKLYIYIYFFLTLARGVGASDPCIIRGFVVHLPVIAVTFPHVISLLLEGKFFKGRR